MTPARTNASRSAFASGFTIVIAGVLLLIAAGLGRYIVRDIHQQSEAALSAQIDLALLSARDWSRLNCQRLQTGETVTLPLDDLVSPTASGLVKLRRVESDGGASMVECDLKIAHGRQTKIRHVYWPLSGN